MTKPIVPSARTEAVKEYYFSRKLKEIAALRAAGEPIISLGIGGPDLPPPAMAVDAAVESLRRSSDHGYQMTVGLPELRHAFASWYNDFYAVPDIDPDTQILPLIGSKEGVNDISLAFLNPGDGVLVPNPGYPTYTSASGIAQAEIFTYDLLPENGWYPDFEQLERMPLDRIKVMWVNYPHMPTGAPATADLFHRLVEFGLRHGILIVNDNPYSFFLNPGRPLSIFACHPRAYEVALEMNSLSKCLNMPGWRVGMVLGNPTFINWILKIKSNIDSGQPKAIMLGAIAALSQPREWYDSLNDVYSARRDVARRILDALGCTYDRGQQGLFQWGRIPDSETSSESLCDRVLDRVKVFITPGFIFGSNGDRYIRISLCAPVDTLTEALNRIQQTL